MTVATRERAKIRGELRSRSRDRLVARHSTERSRTRKRPRPPASHVPSSGDGLDRRIRKVLGRLKFEHYAHAKAVGNGALDAEREARIRRLEGEMDQLLGIDADAPENVPERSQTTQRAAP